jgi:hypothetical protein
LTVTITNQSSHLLICALNSGTNLHLGPGEASAPLDHLEINGNAKITKLARNGSIAIATKETETEDSKPSAAARRSRKETEE